MTSNRSVGRTPSSTRLRRGKRHLPNKIQKSNVTGTVLVLALLLSVLFLQLSLQKYISSPATRKSPHPPHNVPRPLSNSTFSLRRTNDAEKIPQWMKDYFSWHAEQRRKLNPKNFKEFRYLVLRCIDTIDTRACGGLSDRIKPLPLLVLLAAQSDRIFMIYWNKPCRLEEFFIPPPESEELRLDWTVPDWLVPEVTSHDNAGPSQLERILQLANSTKKPLLTVKLQDQHGGSETYNEMVRAMESRPQQPFSPNDISPLVGSNGENLFRAYRNVYGPLFRSLFVPTQPIVKLWKQEAENAGLSFSDDSVPYAAAHLRAYYNVNNPFNVQQIKALTVNAINCASQIRPTSERKYPILFASDSKIALDHAKQWGREMKYPIVTINRGLQASNGNHNHKEPLHLDKADSRNPADYYDVFLDILHFSRANCISHAQGGFGRLGVLLSRNASCLKPIITQGQLVECGWRD